ncbi:HPr kinase/phosphorylase [Aestuariivirga sp.]|uniref:HPr kinase/phosphorylase n=1 Tax=Aestuariivirga sp. TaxID=2650926 RepID=UPI0039E4CEE5
MTPFNIHATTVAIRDAAGTDHGILIRGRPGSGKSELALRLIDAAGLGSGDIPLRARLVADDQTLLTPEGGGLRASAPAALAGLLELRGQGILTLPHLASARVALIVDLRDSHDLERMPEERLLTAEIAGISLPRMALDRAQPAAPAMIRTVLTARIWAQPGALPGGGQKA